jgi:hypothetical protein
LNYFRHPACPTRWPSSDDLTSSPCVPGFSTGHGQRRASATEVTSARRKLKRLTLGDASHSTRPDSRRAPSIGLSKKPPLRRHHLKSPLPRTEVRFGHLPPSKHHGPPMWFLPTLADYSSSGFVGLSHPTTDHEVHRVLHSAVPRQGVDSSAPHRCHTLQSLPLPSSRHCVTAAPMPPRRHRAAHPADLKALLHSRVRCTLPPFPARQCPMLSWASSSWNHVHVVSHLMISSGTRGSRRVS